MMLKCKQLTRRWIARQINSEHAAGCEKKKEATRLSAFLSVCVLHRSRSSDGFVPKYAEACKDRVLACRHT